MLKSNCLKLIATKLLEVHSALQVRPDTGLLQKFSKKKTVPLLEKHASCQKGSMGPKIGP